MIRANKYTICGDPHVTNGNLKIVEKLFQQIEELGNDTIFLGDMFDLKEIIKGKSFNTVFRYLKNSRLQHTLLVGNHDLFHVESQDHSLLSLGELPNVTIVDAPRVSGVLGFVPYMHNPEQFKLETAQLLNLGVKYLFGHQDIQSFDFGNGKISTVGNAADDLVGFKTVILGHYHKYQQRGNLTYLGTPFSHSFGETDQVKYLGIFNQEIGLMELVPTNLPRHLSFDLEISDLEITEKIQEISSLTSDNFVRINLSGTPEEHINFDTSPFKATPIKWVPVVVKSDKKYQLSESLNNQSQFLKWAQDIKKLDSDTTDLGLSILEAVRAK